MDAKADKKWKISDRLYKTQRRWLLWRSDGRFQIRVLNEENAVALRDYLNALQQQLADAEAKAARYEEALKAIIALPFDAPLASALDIAYDTLNPPSPITPECCCPDCVNYCPVHQPQLSAEHNPITPGEAQG